MTDKDKGILRELGKKMAEIASLPIQHQRKAMWARMNRLQDTKSMIWMTDICWNEMEVDHELTSHSHHYHNLNQNRSYHECTLT